MREDGLEASAAETGEVDAPGPAVQANPGIFMRILQAFWDWIHPQLVMLDPPPPGKFATRAEADLFDHRKADQEVVDRPVKASARRFVPNGGADWNPLVNYPRNSPCYCGKLKEDGTPVKFKNCCLHIQPRALSEKAAEKLKPLVKQAQQIREGTV